MPSQTTISKLNRPITIQKFVFGQNDSGGNIKALVLTYDLFADVEQVSNFYVLEQLQLKYGEAYRITFRYEPDRLLTDNDEIIYASRVHKIKGMRYDDDAAKRFLILTTSTGNTSSNTGGGTVFIPIKEYHYVASGGELSFQDDVLKGWIGIILFFRDKSQFRVIRSGSPTTQQVLYDTNAGTYTFNNSIIPMAAGETADIYLINS